MALFDEAALKRIEATVTAVEKQTAAEIVVVSVAASDDYAELRASVAFASGLLGAIIAHVVWPTLLDFWMLLYLQVAVAAIAFWIAGRASVLRLLVPKARAIDSVERRAREEFAEHRVFETRDRTGVLILLAELEHRVVILGDKGIDAHVQHAGWEKHVQTIVSAIQAGRAADGLCAVIEEVGAVLAGHVPARADDSDELANKVRQE